MRLQAVLRDQATTTGVQDRVDVAAGILLERCGDGVGRTRIEEALQRELVAADGCDTEVWQIQNRTRKPSRRDDIVDLKDELDGVLRLSRVYAERLAGALDPFDGGVEHDDAAREDVVLVRLHVSRPDSDERPRVDRQLRG